MEKLAVEEEETPIKTAAAKASVCPDCGTRLLSQELTNVLACPRCGTRPFEGKQP